jgi:hypothetical protein
VIGLRARPAARESAIQLLDRARMIENNEVRGDDGSAMIER